MSDLISRQAAIDAIKEWGLLDGLSEGLAVEILGDEEKVPPAQSYALDEWCDTCKEYDHEKHCCPRYNRVIRDALKMRKKGKWVWLPDREDEHIHHLCCSLCHCGAFDETNYCPNCGADMREGGEDAN